MQRDNTYISFIKFALLQLLLTTQLNVCFDLEFLKKKSIKSYENQYKRFVFIETLFILCFVKHINYAITLIFKQRNIFKIQRFNKSNLTKASKTQFCLLIICFFFYKCTLIISQTINTNNYLEFRVFNAMFNY